MLQHLIVWKKHLQTATTNLIALAMFLINGELFFSWKKGFSYETWEKYPVGYFQNGKQIWKRRRYVVGTVVMLIWKHFLEIILSSTSQKFLGCISLVYSFAPLAARLQPFKMFTKVSRYNCFSICLDSCRHAGIGIYIPEKNSKSYYCGNWGENLIVSTAVPWLMVFFSLITLNFRL